ncbi:MAG: hypothetical protein SAK29_27610 [Scytonema sp. PMC 1069.18]|nr:hypothetical protein [Scytonema sp. PMC 1069.18]MEC4887905.1 hypothetical protein [Scytonema sp. PMC 1070.18]
MKYIFDIVGVSPVLDFFNHQQQYQQKPKILGLEYIGTHQCTLDAFIQSVETVPPKWDWNMDEVVSTVIEFWMSNSERIHYWKSRLVDAGNDTLLVARVADINAMKDTFEALIVNS